MAKQRLRSFRSFAVCLMVLQTACLFAGDAWAVCSAPSGSAGKTIYNSDHHVLQYCDGTNWIGMAKAGFDESLAGWWKFNDGSGTTAVDSSGNGNDGTITGGASWTTGQLGGALSLDGVDDQVNAGNGASTDQNGEMTVSAWYYPNAFPATLTDVLVIKGTSGLHDYNLGINTTGVALGGWSSSLTMLTGVTALSLNTWYHIAMVRTGTSGNWTGTLYVNGVVDKVRTAQTSNPTGTTSLYFGSNAGLDRFADGRLDDIRVYSRALSASEIYRLYQDGTASSPCTSSTEGKMRYNVNRRTLEYCNSAVWRGVSQNYTAWGVTFDGTNDYLTYGTSMGADAKTATGSFWFRRNGGNGSQQVLFCAIDSAGSCRFQISLNTSNQLRVLGKNTSGTTNLDVAGSSAITDTNWHHAIFSFDLSDSTKRSIYIDGTAETPTWTTYTNSNIDFTRTSYSVGAFTNGNSKYSGDLADFYLDMGSYTNLSQAANREKFRDASGKPVDLGYNGSTPSGSQPEVYLSGGTLSSWNTNKGSGGGFTVTGALTEATGTQGEGGIRRGLVGHWKFDESSGTAAADSSGQGNNGTLTNGPAWTTGQLGGALSFDGDDDFVDTGSDMIGISATTLCAWIYPTTTATTPIIAGNGRTILWYAADDEDYKLVFTNDGGGTDGSSGTDSIVLNSWQHVCVTRTASGTANFYIGGSASGTANQNCGTPAALGYNFEIGIHAADESSFPYEGLIDDVRVYNRVLSATDVAALYANAVCSSPAKQEGSILFNGDNSVLQYCDGLVWRSIGK